MSIGTKNRLNQIGIVSKAHLRERYPDKLALVEEYIAEVEGSGKSHDPNRWSQFTDAKRSTADMLERVDAAFGKWLNPQCVHSAPTDLRRITSIDRFSMQNTSTSASRHALCQISRT